VETVEAVMLDLDLRCLVMSTLEEVQEEVKRVLIPVVQVVLELSLFVTDLVNIDSFLNLIFN
jgi:hypothetical protein